MKGKANKSLSVGIWLETWDLTFKCLIANGQIVEVAFGAAIINEVLQLSNVADFGTEFFGNLGTMELYKLSISRNFIWAPPPMVTLSPLLCGY